MQNVDTTSIRSLSNVIEDLCLLLEKESDCKVKTLVEALHERGFGVLIIVFAAPAALPIPGFNTIVALPLVFLTLQQMLGRHTVWIPQKYLERALPKTSMIMTLRKMLPWLKKGEVLIRPRMEWVTTSGPSRFFGFIGTLLALMACLPVPLTHTVPSIGLGIMAAGTLSRDGLTIITGAVIGLGWTFLLMAAISLTGAEALHAVKTFF